MNIKVSKRFVNGTQKITDQRILAKIRQILIDASEKNNFLTFKI